MLVRMRIFAAVAVVVMLGAVGAGAQGKATRPTVLLWEHGAPGAVGATAEDKPQLELFPVAGGGTHVGVVVAPGGGYTHLAYEKEGSKIAEWLNAQGINAFVLTYRLTPRYKYPSPIQDGHRAMRWVRAHAAEYGVDEHKIGMWGFSAGGHLVGIVGTHFDMGDAKSADVVERASDRPDFVVSSYGGLTLKRDVVKPGTMRNMLGEDASDALVDDMSPDLHVDARTPPFFIYGTTTDASVPAMSAITFYSAMKKAGRPVELHIFQEGPHGTALAEKYPALSVWPTLLLNWMRVNGWLAAAVK